MPGKRIYYLAAIFVTVMVVVSCAYVKRSADNESFELAKRGIILRNIGHRLLLQSGDSTSRVLPVREIAENEYQIQFENSFSFQSDSLVSIIKNSLAANRMPGDYVVNVVNAKSPQVLFGYAMLGSEKNSVVPCSGRKQPADHYKVNILFKSKGFTDKQKGYLIGGLPLLAFVGLLVFKPRRRNPVNNATAANSPPNDNIVVGHIIFDKAARQITTADKVISLTVKESKLFLIFALSPNEIIDRARLQKEIWEDEGVIVGRSLDMFISKLRKKLEIAPSVKLINIHGRGFKLEIAE